jgi:hypothetical protein
MELVLRELNNKSYTEISMGSNKKLLIGTATGGLKNWVIISGF